MNLEEIEAALTAALPMRVPYLAPEDSPGRKIELLQDYMLDSARASGDLVEARHWLRALEQTLGDEWEVLQGWETALRKPRARATAADIKIAKARSSPALYDAIRKARSLRESVVEQVQRFEREASAVSRAYTMASGG